MGQQVPELGRRRWGMEMLTASGLVSPAWSFLGPKATAERVVGSWGRSDLQSQEAEEGLFAEHLLSPRMSPVSGGLRALAVRDHSGSVLLTPVVPFPCKPSCSLAPQCGPHRTELPPNAVPQDRGTKHSAPLPAESPSQAASEEHPVPVTVTRPIHLYTQFPEMLLVTVKRQ